MAKGGERVGVKQKIERGVGQKKVGKDGKKNKNTQLIKHHKQISMTLKRSASLAGK